MKTTTPGTQRKRHGRTLTPTSLQAPLAAPLPHKIFSTCYNSQLLTATETLKATRWCMSSDVSSTTSTKFDARWREKHAQTRDSVSARTLYLNNGKRTPGS